MDPAERWREIEELFYSALDLDPDERPAFLLHACQGNSELLQEVQSLLDSAEKPLDFVPQRGRSKWHKRVADEGRKSYSHWVLTGPLQSMCSRGLLTGSELAHYKVISMLGAGGMGEVYLAEDLLLKRKVALKMLAPKLVNDKQRAAPLRAGSACGLRSEPSQYPDHIRIRASRRSALYRLGVRRRGDASSASSRQAILS